MQKQRVTIVQNKTKKNEVTSASTVPTRQPKSSTSIAVTNQSATVFETVRMDAHLSLAYYHQDFVFRKALYDGNESRKTDNDDAYQHVQIELLKEMENKNNNSGNELKAAVDSLWDAVQQVGEYAYEK